VTEPTSSNFPSSLDSNVTLGGDAVNLVSLTLDTSVDASTQTISVAEDISGVNVPCYILVGSELIYATAKSSGNFTNCDRGAGNTSAASHTNGDTVYVVYAANLFNQLKRAIIAVETELGTDPAGTKTDLKTRLASSLDNAGNLDFATSTELTISSGSITPTQNWHTVDTESDAASDDLDTIVATGVTDGFILLLRANNTARTVVIKHNTGNIQVASTTDITLNETYKYAILVYDATLAVWLASANVTVLPSQIIASDGTLYNGRISVSVSSNNLTVAIKTMAGDDPSISDPVYVRINNSIRSITSALSVTRNAGTNWFNSGATAHATYENNYFVYLGWRAASSAVVLGFSRIPYAAVYSEFSATTTDDRHGAFSTTPASTDDVVNIGRFSATLSAGAGYTWTVPTFTSSNLIQRPIYETEWLIWNPSPTGYSAVPTGSFYRYRVQGKTLAYIIREINDGTSNDTILSMTAPFVAATKSGAAWRSLGTGKDNGINLTTPVLGQLLSGGTTINFYTSPAVVAWTGSGAKRITSMQGNYDLA
jgi:hypothetical protein